jgi:hypothetical protein
LHRMAHPAFQEYLSLSVVSYLWATLHDKSGVII